MCLYLPDIYMCGVCVCVFYIYLTNLQEQNVKQIQFYA